MRSVSRRLYLLALTLMIGAAGCGGGQAAEPEKSAPPGARGGGAAAPVTVATVAERAMPVTLHAVGTGEASSTVDIRSQVTGPLLSIGFKEGQDVRAGQTLFTIDPRPFQGVVNQATAALARDTAQLNDLEARLKRADDLLARGIVTRADRDTLAAQTAAMRATVTADNGALESAKLQLSYATITAPVSGRTGALMVHQGSLIRANDTTPMVTISQTSPLNVVFAVPARELPRIRNARGALRVTATVPGVPESAATGTIGFIDSAADPATDTIKIKGVFPNGNHTLWPGQYVDVTVQLAVDEHALVVPTAAVQAGQQGQFVFVVKDGAAELRPVRVAWTDGDTTVIEHGVAAGEQVVTDGQLRLTPGAKVSVKTGAGAAGQ
jgi:multidrug efflux system membrane fusion protein